MKKTTLGKAISMTLAGSVLAIGSATATAHTMYNAYNAGLHSVGTDKQGGTDGWNPTTNWVGTDSSTTMPFGFVGTQALHWAAMIHTNNSSMEVSTADALATYALDADIDTAKGAWFDGRKGWAHNTDYGLIKSEVDTKITLSASTVNNGWTNFGFTVFTGMDDGTGNFDRHSQWNQPVNNLAYLEIAGADDSQPYNASNPHGTNGLNYLTHSGSGDITFTASADQVYSVYLGGADGGTNFGPHDGYVLNIQASPVPVPAAVWLFGSGLLGVLSLGRRRTTMVKL